MINTNYAKRQPRPRRRVEEELEMGAPMMLPIYQPLTKKIAQDGSTIIDYYIYDGDGRFSPDSITNPSYYVNFLALLNDLNPNDNVHVHLNTGGGMLDSSLAIYEGLCNCNAQVTMHVEGPCCSGGSMILMAGDQIIINKFGYVMIHTFSGGMIGKASDMKIKNEFEMKWWDYSFKEIYKDFLTEEEMNDCLNGKDFWFNAVEVDERFNNKLKKALDRDRLVSFMQRETQMKVTAEMTSYINELGELTEKGYKKLKQFDKMIENACEEEVTEEVEQVEKPTKKAKSKDKTPKKSKSKEKSE